MHISVHVSLHYLSLLGQIKAFYFPKRFLFQPNYHQINVADTMIVNLNKKVGN